MKDALLDALTIGASLFAGSLGIMAGVALGVKIAIALGSLAL